MIDYEEDFREALENGDLTVPVRWEGFPSQAFGGFIAGAVLVAVSAETEQPRPLSLFARYHRPVPVGEPVALSIHADRRGRSLDTFPAKLHVGDRTEAARAACGGRSARRDRDRTGARHASNPFRSEQSALASTGDTRHLRAQWPGSVSDDLAIRGAVALMPIDNFPAPATIRANGVGSDTRPSN